ncbi:TetR/AcrR family transcriptional regulator [Prauserella cavernicola]|uniref:TetR/AcrR family transcriptional regulator n=1 Tax=Prauserella cavernicola TaxID=2800127 RepID=A0A934QNA5_9PSEU|nr:TetR/AcrR family transcriptional regulator [Prauserella cavernicola]MBK1783032.1 TetR/AcrR family transcriptional regulator [Prauserella cavernicola]
MVRATRPGGRSAKVGASVQAAALAELVASGYHGLTLDAVAHRAGVHKTTVYRRWGTREALLHDAMRARAQAAVPIPDTGSLRDDLLALARAAIANLATPEVQAVVRTVAALAPHDATVAAASRAFWAERLAVDGEVVERAVARGEIAAVEPREVIEAVLGPPYFRVLVTGEPVTDEFLSATTDRVVAGLRGAERG